MLQKWDSLKRWLILGIFFSVAGYLVWCGDHYSDRNYSIIPAVMCAAESIVLMITGAALMRRRPESEFDE